MKMKNLRYTFAALFLLLTVSCAKEVVEPGQMLTGKYVLEDGSGLCEDYIAFKDGYCEYHITKDMTDRTFAEQSYWKCSPEDFKLHSRVPYSLSAGELTFWGNFLFSSGSVKDGVLHLDGKAFTSLKAFRDEYWSSLSLPDGPAKTLDYTGQEVSIPVVVTRPIPAGKHTIRASADWISRPRMEEGNLIFQVPETKSDATAQITLGYTNAAPLTLTVTRTPSTAIILEESERTVSYAESSQQFSYSVDNPLPESFLLVTSDVTWVKNIQSENGVLSFDIAENNSGKSRTATLTLSYSGARDVTFLLTQSWSASEITVTPESQSATYIGGTFSFDFEVTNPREGASVTAQSQTSWITDVVVDGNKVSYKVAENNSGASRSSKIRLTYGNFATKDFTMIQSWSASEITVTPESQSATYTGGTFSFDFGVTNPREGASVTAQSQTSWITDVVVNGNNVSYKVEENNSYFSRTGNLRLKYGNYATKDFDLNQSSHPITNFSLNKAELNLFIGNSENLHVTTFPEDVSLIWSSSNTTVANVDQYGLVTAKSPGSSIITVMTEDGNKSATCNLTVHEIIDLSSIETANSYIISQSGGYKIKTVKGNSSQSVGSVASSEVLWESFGTTTTPSVGDVVSDAYYRDGYIRIIIPQNIKNGNAVIAAKDASGNILWSWHIWVCKGYDPAATAQTYYNNAGVMMDRNLGATSATPGDVGALGLLYQWGRKDPFLGSSSILSSPSTKAKSTLSWPFKVPSNSSNGTIAYATAHPTTFITRNDSNNDWYYTGSSSSDNTRWQSSKTIYDPCPPGWRVPDGGSSGVWSKAVGSSRSFTRTYDSTNKGMNFSGKFGSASTIWYPASGYQSFVDGSLYSVGSLGYWWSCTPNVSTAYYLIYIDGNVGPSGSGSRADGLSVRCLQE